MNSRVPLLAMVPRLSMASCCDRPMPLSAMVSVFASLSKLTRTSRLGASSYSALSFSASKRSLSQASDALEISSRRKISLLEYREWVTRCSSCATSAWKERVCFWLMGFWWKNNARQRDYSGRQRDKINGRAYFGAAGGPVKGGRSDKSLQ